MCYNELSSICAPKEGDLWEFGSQYTIEWNAAYHTFQNTSYIDILLYSERFDLIKNISHVPIQQNSLTVTIDKTWKSSSQHSFLSIVSSTTQSRSTLIQLNISPGKRTTLLTKRDLSMNNYRLWIIIVGVVIFLGFVFVLFLRNMQKKKNKNKNKSNGTELSLDPSPPPYSAETPPTYQNSSHTDHCHIQMDHGGHSSHN